MILTIIQARMGSQRLPGKTLMVINGKTMLQRVIDRVSMSKLRGKIVIATTDDAVDVNITKVALSNNLSWFRGPNNDVLSRFYKCASYYGDGEIEAIVRITSDCPLIDPEIIDEQIKMFLSGMYSFVSSTGEGKYPDGMDVEVFSFETLSKAWKEAESSYDREHVTSYILKNPDIWTTYSFKPKLPPIKLSVDTQEDLERVSMISKALGDRFKLQDVYDMIEKKNQLNDIWGLSASPGLSIIPVEVGTKVITSGPGGSGYASSINVEYVEIVEP